MPTVDAYRLLTPPIQHPLPQFALLLFDADGTLRYCLREGQPCPNKPGEWALLPNVQATLSHYDWQQTGIGVCSNQGGVALGFLTEYMARLLLRRTLEAAVGHRALRRPHQVGLIWCCPHTPNASCPCRKPKPLLLEQAQMSWYSAGLLHGPEEVLYVGDQESDREAAEAAGITFCWERDFFAWG